VAARDQQGEFSGLLDVILQAAAGTAASEITRRAFTPRVGKDSTMPQIVGGAEIIGADADLLDALSMSGDYDGEIGGYQEIVGGGAPGRNRNAARAIKMRHAVAVEEGKYSVRRRFPIGFVVTTVNATLSATITSLPQDLFRGERLVVPSDIAFDFGISDFKVGNESQFVAGGEIPAAMFTEVAIDTDVHFKTAVVGNQLVLVVRNKNTLSNLDFTAGSIGAAVR
jgi:hypothetical protein